MKKSGLTLVELMVGLMVFALLGLSYFQITSSLSRETQFSMETYQSQLLSLKIAEFINQAAITNPIAPENLNGVAGDVVGGTTPIFQRINNSKKTISFQSTLGAIEQDSVDFYSQIKKYGLKIETKSNVDEYYSVNCCINWNTKTGKGSTFTTRFFPKVHRARNIDVEAIFSDEDLDNFCSNFFFASNLPLENTVTSGSISTIRDLGRIFFLAINFLSDEEYENNRKNIQNLKIALQSGITQKEKVKVLQTLAAQSFEMAKNTYLIMLKSEEPFARIRTGYNFSGLGQITNKKELLQKGFKNYIKVCNLFNESIWTARNAYLELVDNKYFSQLGSRRQYFNLLKAINLARIISINDIGNSYAVNASRSLDILNKLKEDFKGQNSHIERLIQQEISFYGNAEKQVKTFPYLKSIYKIIGQENGVSKNLKFIKTKMSEI